MDELKLGQTIQVRRKPVLKPETGPFYTWPWDEHGRPKSLDEYDLITLDTQEKVDLWNKKLTQSEYSL
jgi:hypothetical protein